MKNLTLFALLALTSSSSAFADLSGKSVSALTRTSIEHAAKIHATTHRLYSGVGYTYRIRCSPSFTATECIQDVYKNVEHYSKPDGISIEADPSVDDLMDALTNHKIKGSAGALSESEHLAIDTTLKSLRAVLADAMKDKGIQLYTGYEGNSFGAATFVGIYDSKNSELALFGNGYAE